MTDLSLAVVEELKTLVAVDASSPSGLIWTKPPTRGRVKAGNIAGYDYGSGYYKVSIKGRRYRTSHLVLYLSGVYPEAGQTEVDHIDRNPRNNALSNLRWTDRSGNLANRRVMGCVPYRYVHCSRGRYTAQYTHPATKKQVFVGRYDTPIIAHYQALAHRLENHWINQ